MTECKSETLNQLDDLTATIATIRQHAYGSNYIMNNSVGDNIGRYSASSVWVDIDNVWKDATEQELLQVGNSLKKVLS